VAVRVRPFNAREQNLNAKCCIKMVSNLNNSLYEYRLAPPPLFGMMKETRKISLLISVSGHTTALEHVMMAIQNLKMISTLISALSIIW